MKKIALMFCLCLWGFFCVGCGDEKTVAENTPYQSMKLVMMTSGTANGIDTQIAGKIAEKVKEESKGAIIIEVYPNEELAGGNTNRAVSMIADGSVDLAVYSSGTWSILDPQLSAATVPWLFADYKTARQTIDRTGGKYYEKALAQKGLYYLGFAHNGMRQIFNNARPVKSPNDLYGLKIRILSNETSLRFFRFFGLDPMPMSWSEVPTALKHGHIDGHDAGVYTARSADIADDTKYMTLLNYSYETYIFAACSKTFDRLPQNTRDLLRKNVIEACEWGKDYIEENEEKILRQFADDGMNITELTPKEREVFIEKSRDIVNELKTRYDEEARLAFGM